MNEFRTHDVATWRPTTDEFRVEVVRPLTDAEKDPEVGPMFLVQAHAYKDELLLLERGRIVTVPDEADQATRYRGLIIDHARDEGWTLYNLNRLLDLLDLEPVEPKYDVTVSGPDGDTFSILGVEADSADAALDMVRDNLSIGLSFKADFEFEYDGSGEMVGSGVTGEIEAADWPTRADRRLEDVSDSIATFVLQDLCSFEANESDRY